MWVRRILRGDGAIHLLPTLIEKFDCGKALGHESAGAVELLLRQRDLGLLLREVRLRLVERALRLAHQRLDFFSEASRSRVSIIATTWPAAHHVAFVDEELRDAAGKLGVDVDFVGFEPTISGGDAGRQLRLMLMPPDQPMPAPRADQQQQSQDHDTRSPTAAVAAAALAQ